MCTGYSFCHVRISYRRSRPAAGQLRVVVSAASPPEITGDCFRGAPAGAGPAASCGRIKSGQPRCLSALPFSRYDASIPRSGSCMVFAPVAASLSCQSLRICVNGRKRRKHLRRGLDLRIVEDEPEHLASCRQNPPGTICISMRR